LIQKTKLVLQVNNLLIFGIEDLESSIVLVVVNWKEKEQRKLNLLKTMYS